MCIDCNCKRPSSANFGTLAYIWGKTEGGCDKLSPLCDIFDACCIGKNIRNATARKWVGLDNGNCLVWDVIHVAGELGGDGTLGNPLTAPVETPFNGQLTDTVSWAVGGDFGHSPAASVRLAPSQAGVANGISVIGGQGLYIPQFGCTESLACLADHLLPISPDNGGGNITVPKAGGPATGAQLGVLVDAGDAATCSEPAAIRGSDGRSYIWSEIKSNSVLGRAAVAANLAVSPTDAGVIQTVNAGIVNTHTCKNMNYHGTLRSGRTYVNFAPGYSFGVGKQVALTHISSDASVSAVPIVGQIQMSWDNAVNNGLFHYPADSWPVEGVLPPGGSATFTIVNTVFNGNNAAPGTLMQFGRVHISVIGVTE